MIKQHLREKIAGLYANIYTEMGMLFDWLKDPDRQNVLTHAADLINTQQQLIREMEEDADKKDKRIAELESQELRHDVFRSPQNPWQMGKSRMY